MNRSSGSTWNEEEYVAYLNGERHLFAWCLVVIGGVSQSTADASATEFYKYESPEDPHRGLVFHDLAWHWAMLKIFGEGYWRLRPELEKPSSDYIAESYRIGWA